MNQKDRQDKGGSLIIPNGWVVSGASFDESPPFIKIWDIKLEKEEKLLIPESLAYYLSTHFCGSYRMKRVYIEQGENKVISGIRNILKL